MAAAPIPVWFLVFGMLLSGTVSTLSTKYQDRSGFDHAIVQVPACPL